MGQNFDNINNILINLNNKKNLNLNLKEKEIQKKKKENEKQEKCVCKKNKKIPSLDEVKRYVSFYKLVVNPEVFFNYYESNGWVSAGQPIVNWKAKIKTWHLKNKKEDCRLKIAFVKSLL